MSQITGETSHSYVRRAQNLTHLSEAASCLGWSSRTAFLIEGVLGLTGEIMLELRLIAKELKR
jgi:hypothetical protein